MIVVASDAHRDHHASELHDGDFGPSFEGPERAERIASALAAEGHALVGPDPLDLDLVGRVHDADYVEFLADAWDRWTERGLTAPMAMAHTWPPRGSAGRRPTDLVGRLGYHSFAADTTIGAGTWSAVSSSAALAQSAADRLAADGEAVYALCRPPGHHATTDQFGGYCYLNNAAVAAQRLVDRGSATVAVLDVDYHHGNGTQHIFEARRDVFVASVHADPIEEFPWFSGHADETGVDDGAGWTLNLPLPRGTDVPTWMATLDRAVDRIGDLGVEALVVSLGVDTYVGDPLGTFALDTGDFTLAARRIAELGLPTVVVQEGGYADDALGRNVAAFLAGLS